MQITHNVQKYSSGIVDIHMTKCAMFYLCYFQMIELNKSANVHYIIVKSAINVLNVFNTISIYKGYYSCGKFCKSSWEFNKLRKFIRVVQSDQY